MPGPVRHTFGRLFQRSIRDPQVFDNPPGMCSRNVRVLLNRFYLAEGFGDSRLVVILVVFGVGPRK